MNDIVVGSGPSGISVATALLARGRTVLMLDGGRGLEPEALQRRDHLAATTPADWTRSERDAYQAVQHSATSGLVRRYGSDFAQEAPETTLSASSDWFELRASHAVGGLSNIWGSAVLPNRQADITGWPISIDDLKPHYQAVAKFMPVAGRVDGLAAILPGFSMQDRQAIPPSPQGGELLRRLERSKKITDGIHFGAARHAVDTSCQQCGMCLHGCPWSYIYSAAKTLEVLKQHPNFSYKSGCIIQGLSETEGDVILSTTDGETLSGNRVFLATGVLETTKIMLASGLTPDELILRDSQHGFMPMLHRWRSPRKPDALPFTTLPQAFVELEIPSISPFLVHSQIYTWNDHYARDLSASYGKILPGSGPLWSAVAKRLIVAQTFLHSDHSASVGLRLNTNGQLDATLYKNSQTDEIFAAARQKLATVMSKIGVHALSFASRTGAPGSSFHSGGTLPMSADPKAGQSDPLGRPYGLKRTHIVDASVLPSIPATTITFSVMANAHRIGSLAD